MNCKNYVRNITFTTFQMMRLDKDKDKDKDMRYV